MRNTRNIIFWMALLGVVFLVPVYVPADQQQKGDRPADAKLKSNIAVLDMTEIIPLSANLSGLFTRLKNNLEQSDDFSAVEKEYAAIEADLEAYNSSLEQLKETGGHNFKKIYALWQAIEAKKSLLKDINKPLKNEIKQVDRWKTKWLSEKERWEVWQ